MLGERHERAYSRVPCHLAITASCWALHFIARIPHSTFLLLLGTYTKLCHCEFPFFERRDREWKQAQRQGDFLDNSSTQKTKGGPKLVLSPKVVTALRPLKDDHPRTHGSSKGASSSSSVIGLMKVVVLKGGDR
jgi:hypothetical protein